MPALLVVVAVAALPTEETPDVMVETAPLAPVLTLVTTLSKPLEASLATEPAPLVAVEYAPTAPDVIVETTPFAPLVTTV